MLPSSFVSPRPVINCFASPDALFASLSSERDFFSFVYVNSAALNDPFHSLLFLSSRVVQISEGKQALQKVLQMTLKRDKNRHSSRYTVWAIACTLLWYICGKNAMAREKKRCSLFPLSFPDITIHERGRKEERRRKRSHYRGGNFPIFSHCALERRGEYRKRAYLLSQFLAHFCALRMETTFFFLCASRIRNERVVPFASHYR